MTFKTLMIASATFFISATSAGESVELGSPKLAKETFYEVLCHDANTHRLIYRDIYSDRFQAEISLSTCEEFLGVGSLTIGQR
ncbi:hypothetical protein C1E24_06875 [Pseudoalteromonas phenolica]|uniref:Uncharacterized protein n=1 Tax=Pseudoalteromonas phenolica TaxID=161398 RepID=A0A5R9Q480_9GAMM|nr:hypothetical protein [Pseudoalteromonas phenolica]TLX47953.1 hypothetical protein C1E24_06875 [Pseudoalteromonas phenolica]